MANRVLQQKRMKMKRMRRAYLKKFSMKSTGPVANPGYLNDKGDFVGISFGDRSKLAASTIDQHVLTKYRFNPNSNEAIYARTGGLHTDIWPGGKEIILAKLVQSRGNCGSLQGERRYVYQNLPTDNPNYTLRLYMSGEDCFFMAEIVTKTERIYKISMEYTMKERALDARRHDRISWEQVDRVPLPSEPT